MGIMDIMGSALIVTSGVVFLWAFIGLLFPKAFPKPIQKRLVGFVTMFIMSWVFLGVGSLFVPLDELQSDQLTTTNTSMVSEVDTEQETEAQKIAREKAKADAQRIATERAEAEAEELARKQHFDSLNYMYPYDACNLWVTKRNWCESDQSNAYYDLSGYLDGIRDTEYPAFKACTSKHHTDAVKALSCYETQSSLIENTYALVEIHKENPSIQIAINTCLLTEDHTDWISNWSKSEQCLKLLLE